MEKCVWGGGEKGSLSVLWVSFMGVGAGVETHVAGGFCMCGEGGGFTCIDASRASKSEVMFCAASSR